MRGELFLWTGFRGGEYDTGPIITQDPSQVRTLIWVVVFYQTRYKIHTTQLAGHQFVHWPTCIIGHVTYTVVREPLSLTCE